ncbi:MAG: TetR family transcriptional regulator [Devosia sp.]|jgi:AcrR family transcriptional regulator|uniref:TetR family transcriptional regulator n=1 Tax=Devosia sp. TaxID=1871048 RepID=UPI0019EDBC48|nr:TetR family transcriptional regulator [Devosia sp.]MBF0677875.1 TetR family transcriptional regulator [Devosia sp.]
MVQRIKNIQPRSLQTRTTILSAVERLWQTRSFDAITIAEIAAEAGIAKGTVLAHFSEKLAILAQFLGRALDEATTALEQEPDFARDARSLSNSVLPLLAYLLRDKALLRLLTTDGDDGQCHDILDPALLRLREALTKGFAAMQILDPDLCADVFIALVVQVVVSGHVVEAEQARIELARLAAILYR